MTRSALSAQKIKVCDINYVPSPETRFCFHLCCGELTFTWRQVFTILRLNLVIMWSSKNTKFIIFFQWSTSIKWILPEVPTKNCKKQKFSMGFHFTISSIFLQKILQDLRRGRDNLSKSACRPQTKVVSTSTTGPILIWTTRLFLRWSAQLYNYKWPTVFTDKELGRAEYKTLYNRTDGPGPGQVKSSPCYK